MRRMLYLGLTESLKELKDESGQPLIRHIDLWNEQVEFIEQEEPFDTLAVFIEFRPVQWRTLGGTTQQADVPFRLHVVTKWQGSARDGSMFQDESLARFDLLDKIDSGRYGYPPIIYRIWGLGKLHTQYRHTSSRYVPFHG